MRVSIKVGVGVFLIIGMGVSLMIFVGMVYNSKFGRL